MRTSAQIPPALRGQATTTRSGARTVVLPSLGLELPTLYHRGLMGLYAPLVYAALRLRSGETRTSQPSALYTRLLSQLEAAEAQALAEGVPRAVVEEAELAVLAMLDSAALSSDAAVRRAWEGETLEQRRRKSGLAGEAFSRAYEQVLRQDNPDLLELYVWALRTGFSGDGSRERSESDLRRGEARLAELHRTDALLDPGPPPPRKGRASAPASLPLLRAALVFVLVLLAITLGILAARGQAVGTGLAEILPSPSIVQRGMIP